MLLDGGRAQTCIVHQNLHRAKGCLDLRGKGRRPARPGQVGPKGPRHTAPGCQLCLQGQGLFFAVVIMQCHGISFFCKSAAKRLANAPCPAGDQNCFHKKPPLFVPTPHF